jgi:hypothetical protein
LKIAICLDLSENRIQYPKIWRKISQFGKPLSPLLSGHKICVNLQCETNPPCNDDGTPLHNILSLRLLNTPNDTCCLFLFRVCCEIPI